MCEVIEHNGHVYKYRTSRGEIVVVKNFDKTGNPVDPATVTLRRNQNGGWTRVR